METTNSLVNYYKKQGGVILVGLTDAQLIDVRNPKSKNTTFNLIAEMFKESGVPTLAINTGSTLYNKAEHAKAIVEEDLTAREIQILNSYSFLSSATRVINELSENVRIKALREFGMRIRISDKLERLCRAPLGINVTPNTKLSTLLENKPVILTSLFTNNLMRAVANDPLKIRTDYERRDKTSNFDYTMSKIKDRKTQEEVMESVKRAFDSILSRTNGDTYGIGLFLPKGMSNNPGLDQFAEYVEMYNRAYEDLCKSLGVSYVDVSSAGKTTGTINFQANPEFIKECILERMIRHIFYERHIERKKEIIKPEHEPQGLLGVEHRARCTLEEATESLSANETDPVLINTRREREEELRIAEKATNTTNPIMKVKIRGC